MNDYIEAYTSSRSLAMDICFAMGLAYCCSNMEVSYVQDFGWHITCDCTDKKLAMKQLRILMKGKSFDSVNWM